MLAAARDAAVQAGSASSIASLDAGLVEIALAACQLTIQAGHTELGVARIQALLEFACLTNVYAAPGQNSLVCNLIVEYRLIENIPWATLTAVQSRSMG